MDLSTTNTHIGQKYISVPTEDSVTSFLKSYPGLNSDAIKETDSSRYANGKDIRLVILGPIVLFSDFELATISGRHLVFFSHDQIVSSMYKLKTGAKDTDDLSIGFDGDRRRGRDEFTTNKNINGKYHVRIMLRDIFDSAKH